MEPFIEVGRDSEPPKLVLSCLAIPPRRGADNTRLRLRWSLQLHVTCRAPLEDGLAGPIRDRIARYVHRIPFAVTTSHPSLIRTPKKGGGTPISLPSHGAGKRIRKSGSVTKEATDIYASVNGTENVRVLVWEKRFRFAKLGELRRDRRRMSSHSSVAKSLSRSALSRASPDLPPRVVPHPMLVPAPVEGREGRASSGTRATA